ncbi:hypothetical protein EYD13_15120 [Saccharomonospora xinjiangensis]|nr:hypothetical protein EYD13_15120 [Saccharomonospora xinjiangensis]
MRAGEQGDERQSGGPGWPWLVVVALAVAVAVVGAGLVAAEPALGGHGADVTVSRAP